MRTRGHRGGTVPRGLGRSSAATPSAILLTRPLGHKPLGAACPPQQQVSPLTEKPWPLGSTSSSPTPGAVWTAPPSVRGGPGGRGYLPPGAALWAMLCWEPGPGANGLSRGRRLGRTPPIDLRRNATSLAGVTRPSPASPFRIRGATNGVGVPMARRTLQRAQGPSGHSVGRGIPASEGRRWRPPIGDISATADPDRLVNQLPFLIGGLGRLTAVRATVVTRSSRRTAWVITGAVAFQHRGAVHLGQTSTGTK
jgi:hypothetical protein